MAISASSYSVGNRVYNGGSSAPTRGTVDPTGYIDRELNKPMASQSRSGLAGAALRRLGDPSASNGQANQQQQQAPGQQMRAMSVSGQADGGGAGPMGGMGRPSVDITGRITGPAQVQTTGLPFDADAAGARTELANQNNQVELDFERTQRDFERDIMLADRDLQEGKPQDQRNLLESYGGRGMVQSSGYGYDQAQLQGSYAKMFGELAQGKSEGLADLLRQRGLWSQTMMGRLQAIQEAATRRAADSALAQGGGMGGATGGGSEEFGGAPVGGFEPGPVTQEPMAPQAPMPQAPMPQAPQSPVGNGPTMSPTPQSVRDTVIGGDGGSTYGQTEDVFRNLAIRNGTIPNPATPAPAPALNSGPSANRSLDSFSAAARKQLQSGAIVTGGDQRRFKLVNGVATLVR